MKKYSNKMRNRLFTLVSSLSFAATLFGAVGAAEVGVKINELKEDILDRHQVAYAETVKSGLNELTKQLAAGEISDEEYARKIQGYDFEAVKEAIIAELATDAQKDALKIAKAQEAAFGAGTFVAGGIAGAAGLAACHYKDQLDNEQEETATM